MRRICVICKKPPSDTPELNVWTRKGLVHVSCIVGKAS